MAGLLRSGIRPCRYMTGFMAKPSTCTGIIRTDMRVLQLLYGTKLGSGVPAFLAYTAAPFSYGHLKFLSWMLSLND